MRRSPWQRSALPLAQTCTSVLASCSSTCPPSRGVFARVRPGLEGRLLDREAGADRGAVAGVVVRDRLKHLCSSRQPLTLQSPAEVQAVRCRDVDVGEAPDLRQQRARLAALVLLRRRLARLALLAPGGLEQHREGGRGGLAVVVADRRAVFLLRLLFGARY